jgi:hypothetical protein
MNNKPESPADKSIVEKVGPNVEGTTPAKDADKTKGPDIQDQLQTGIDTLKDPNKTKAEKGKDFAHLVEKNFKDMGAEKYGFTLNENMKGCVSNMVEKNPEETKKSLEAMQKLTKNPNNQEAKNELVSNVYKIAHDNPKEALKLAIEAGKQNPETKSYAQLADAINKIPIISTLAEKCVQYYIKGHEKEIKKIGKDMLGAGATSQGEVSNDNPLQPSPTPKVQGAQTGLQK